MDRIEYDVVRIGPRWRVRTSGFGQDFDTQAEALFGALLLARQLWDSLHAPCGVRVQLADGRWHEARSFGEATPAG
jgi:hypothetical protein